MQPSHFTLKKATLIRSCTYFEHPLLHYISQLQYITHHIVTPTSGISIAAKFVLFMVASHETPRWDGPPSDMVFISTLVKTIIFLEKPALRKHFIKWIKSTHLINSKLVDKIGYTLPVIILSSKTHEYLVVVYFLRLHRNIWTVQSEFMFKARLEFMLIFKVRCFNISDQIFKGIYFSKWRYIISKYNLNWK